jgi:hypothetical protein
MIRIRIFKYTYINTHHYTHYKNLIITDCTYIFMNIDNHKDRYHGLPQGGTGGEGRIFPQILTKEQ